MRQRTISIIVLAVMLLSITGGCVTIKFETNVNQDNKIGIAFETQTALQESANQNTPVAVTTTPQSTTTVLEGSTQSINGLYDDFNNPAHDGKAFDNTKWSLAADYPGACNLIQQNGYLIITHTPPSYRKQSSGCVLQGQFDGIAGDSFQLFEAKMFISNDFQGTCCGYLQLVIGSSSFSGGGGFIGCSIQPQAGGIAGVFNITHGQGEDEFWRQVETTFNNWHTLSLQIDPTSYTVSCYLDNKLIGSVIPKDAALLKDSNFARYIQVGWPENSTGTYQLDDVRIGTIQPSTTTSSLLFSEDFEDGKAQMVKYVSGNWKIIADDSGNKVYDIDNSDGSAYPEIDFGSATWKDYVTEYRVRFLAFKDRNAILAFRLSDDHTYAYIVALEPTTISLHHIVHGNGWQPITVRTYNTQPGIWYSVRVEVKGIEIKVYIDDSLLIDTEDSQISAGSLQLSVGPGTHTQFDDIRVIALGQ